MAAVCTENRARWTSTVAVENRASNWKKKLWQIWRYYFGIRLKRKIQTKVEDSGTLRIQVQIVAAILTCYVTGVYEVILLNLFIIAQYRKLYHESIEMWTKNVSINRQTVYSGPLKIYNIFCSVLFYLIICNVVFKIHQREHLNSKVIPSGGKVCW